MDTLDPRLTRRAALGSLGAAFLSLALHRTGVAGEFRRWDEDDDVRFGALKDLDGYFPFEPPADREAWTRRAEEVRRRILVASGLWPMPTRPALVPVIHGKVERDDYTVEKVYFESFPGLYVTGNLYRPKGGEGRKPGILSPHGHWQDGRFHDHGPEKVKREIELGAEKFEVGGRHPVQARCVHLARMGCVVFVYDMLGYADSVPLTQELAHGFRKQRPELSGRERWGLFSAQAELRLQNVFGLQLWNSMRALDFLAELPDVDPSRLGVTGESGGGTQTMILAAVDDRPAAIFPAVMVSTAMQGGCTCENASLLRVETGNIEFAALAAPRAQAMTGANDWTREIETKGLPQLKAVYELMGAPGKVEAKYFPFEHNYNAPSRAMMYGFMSKVLGLGESVPEERDYVPLSREEASVWNAAHPKPPCDEDAEVRLLQVLDADARRAVASAVPRDGSGKAGYDRAVGDAIRTMVGRAFPTPEQISHEVESEEDGGDHSRYLIRVRREPGPETLPTLVLHPKEWNGRVVVWVHPEGKKSLLGADGSPHPAALALVRRGVSVAAADLLGQGDHSGGLDWSHTRSVENPREFLGYTAGYNHTLFAQRVHDVLNLLAGIKHHPLNPRRIDLLALGGAARWAAPAGFVAGQGVVSGMALQTGNFRFGAITEIRDPDLWPGAVRYGDLPGLLSVCAPIPMWVADDGAEELEVVRVCYRGAGASEKLKVCPSGAEAEEAVEWLLKG